MKRYIKASAEVDYIAQEIESTIFNSAADYLTEHGDEAAVDWLQVDVTKDPEDPAMLRVEVRCELDYDELTNLNYKVIDPILEQYDPDAYMDMYSSGIAVGYVDTLHDTRREALIDKLNSYIGTQVRLVSYRRHPEFDQGLGDKVGSVGTIVDVSSDEDVFGGDKAYGYDFNSTWWDVEFDGQVYNMISGRELEIV